MKTMLWTLAALTVAANAGGNGADVGVPMHEGATAFYEAQGVEM